MPESVDLGTVVYDITDSVLNTLQVIPHDSLLGYKVQKTSAIQYDLSSPGLCGSIIVSKDGVVKGHHVCGNSVSGYASIWSVEVLNRVYNVLVNDSKLILDVNVSSKVIENFSGVKLEFDPHLSTPKCTSIVPSPLFEAFPVSRIPADLSVYGPHTIKDVEKKSFHPVKHVSVLEVNFASDVVREVVHSNFEPLSAGEIVAGTPLLAGLNKKSSNGIIS